ncbi:sensor domain-containing phosphodiesterase [Aquipuribacter nitratireducens]|uniref:EAL domain-containing protein n=1 Tax=Aquipuribacter nitratireducens TaxID=650104 RepID=A0ABW0GLS6_9MICO
MPSGSTALSRASTRHVEARLREVLADPQRRDSDLDVHFQPIVALPRGDVVEVEALVRWHDERLGEVPPDVLVGVAEDSRLVGDLGRWVLERASRAAASWPDGAGGRPAVAVNVSPLQLEEPGFVDDVRGALARSGLPADGLVLEVTEAVGVADPGATHSVLSTLRRDGVRVALDDFGMGRSSLTLLRDLPLDLVKIDRSFVSGPRRGASDAVLLRLLVDACHSLGLQLVAEGVEDEAQARTVTALGVDRAQGWYFGRPAPDADGVGAASRAPVPTPLDVRAEVVGPDRPTHRPDEFVLVSTPDHRVLFASSAVHDVLGYLPAEVAGGALTAFVHEPDVALMSDPDDVATAPGERLLRVRHRDGSLRYLRSRTDVVDDPDHGPRVVTLCRDVTPVELDRREARVAASTFERVFEEAPCGMSVTGLDGVIRSANRALADLYGRGPDEVVGRHIDDLTHPDDRAVDAVNLAAQAGGAVERVTVRKRVLRPDGAVLPVEVVASVVRDEDGTPSLIVAHVTAVVAR